MRQKRRKATKKVGEKEVKKKKANIWKRMKTKRKTGNESCRKTGRNAQGGMVAMSIC